MFWVFNFHTPSSRRPSQRWPVPGLCPSGKLLHRSPLQIHNHHEVLSAASKMLLMTVFSCSSLTPRSLKVHRSEWPAKASAHDLDWLTTDFLAVVPALCAELCKLNPLMLVGFFNPVFPGYSSRMTTCLVESDISITSGYFNLHAPNWSMFLVWTCRPSCCSVLLLPLLESHPESDGASPFHRPDCNVA